MDGCLCWVIRDAHARLLWTRYLDCLVIRAIAVGCLYDGIFDVVNISSYLPLFISPT